MGLALSGWVGPSEPEDRVVPSRSLGFQGQCCAPSPGQSPHSTPQPCAPTPSAGSKGPCASCFPRLKSREWAGGGGGGSRVVRLRAWFIQCRVDAESGAGPFRSPSPCPPQAPEGRLWSGPSCSKAQEKARKYGCRPFQLPSISLVILRMPKS